MELNLIRAEPAGNITIFVLNPPKNEKERLKAAKILLEDKSLSAEQAGFVYPPEKEGGLWRLEMTGGEFCANASRSFALLVAVKTGLYGKHTVLIETSGSSSPVPVHIDTNEQTAEIEIKPTVNETQIDFEGKTFPVYIFEGITHIIAENMQVNEELARNLICKIVSAIKTADTNSIDDIKTSSIKDEVSAEHGSSDAIGVMFYDTQKKFMQPVVWTRAMDSFVFESSCGSGTAALGVRMVKNKNDIELDMDIAQPGGIIKVCVLKQGGKITRLSISGKVDIGEELNYNEAYLRYEY